MAGDAVKEAIELAIQIALETTAMMRQTQVGNKTSRAGIQLLFNGERICQR